MSRATGSRSAATARCSHAQGKDPILIEGQGRWRMLHAQEPGEMWIKYRQAFVYEKKTVSDL